MLEKKEQLLEFVKGFRAVIRWGKPERLVWYLHIWGKIRPVIRWILYRTDSV